jgi:hypothetical protein
MMDGCKNSRLRADAIESGIAAYQIVSVSCAALQAERMTLAVRVLECASQTVKPPGVDYVRIA